MIVVVGPGVVVVMVDVLVEVRELVVVTVAVTVVDDELFTIHGQYKYSQQLRSFERTW